MKSRIASRKKHPPVGYQLKITLRGSKPPIWRRILVPAGCTLEHVHYAIQNAMGWDNSHLHGFEIAGETYSGRMPFADPMDSEGLDAAAYRLCDVAGKKTKFTYQYDFGDNWDHRSPWRELCRPFSQRHSHSLCSPLCASPANAPVPREDCGGLWGYYDLLEVLGNPKHAEHKEMKEWAGEIDPDAFDSAEANKRLSRIRRK